MFINDIKIKTYNSFSLSQEYIRIIRSLLSEVFPISSDLWNEIYSKKYISMCSIFIDKGNIIAHGSIVKRQVKHKGKKFNLGGIGNIFVIPSYRHLGIGGKVLSSMNDMLKNNKFDLGVLFCHPKLHNYYTGGNWIKKENGKIFYNENGHQKSEETTYLYPLSISKTSLNNWINDDIFIGDGSW